MSDTASLLERIDNLERRVNSIEAAVHKRGVMANAIKTVVAKWPGPFTAKQIRDAVHQYFPDALPAKDYFQIENYLRRMEKSGLLICIERGYGSKGTIYERVANPDRKAGVPGGRHHVPEYESGFRSLVRSALDELPDKFSLHDLRSWVAAKAPNIHIPYGSWTSQLYKLTQKGELVVVKEHHAVKHKLYARGPVRVGPSGDELRELEASWQEFKASMQREGMPVSAPEILTPAARAEV